MTHSIRIAFVLLLAATLFACGSESATPTANDPGALTVCTPVQCGPPPEVATYTCWDGSVAGFTGRCIADQRRQCGWELRECPPQPCGEELAECGQHQYCRYEFGACGTSGAQGVCRERPQLCPMNVAPVCGCDNQTYGNACQAAQAGASVAYVGACEPRPCGGPHALGCGPDEFCEYVQSSCFAPNAWGLCAPKPRGCLPADAPVCGCDGQVYPSACAAHLAGTDDAHPGACVNPAEFPLPAVPKAPFTVPGPEVPGDPQAFPR